MLKDLNGRHITRMPRKEVFDDVVVRLGPVRTHEVRQELDRIIDGYRRNDRNGKRSISSSGLGSQLEPWTHPLTHLDDVASEILGAGADAKELKKRSSWSFGLFLWERMLGRAEWWVFYDPNPHGLGAGDPDDDNILGKIYIEE